MLLGIVGLMGSLFIRPRRAWVRVSRDGSGRTVVELAGLDRSSGGDLAGEVDELERSIRTSDARTGARGVARVSTAEFAAFSDNAIMFASIVYVLAFLAHLVEWVLLALAAGPRDRAAARAGGAGATGWSSLSRPVISTSSISRRPIARRRSPGADAERELRVETCGRIGLALTVLGCALHALGLVSRGLASDPVRVPWGNMYEFTLAGTFGVSASCTSC